MTRPTRARRRAVLQACLKTDYLAQVESIKFSQVVIGGLPNRWDVPTLSGPLPSFTVITEFVPFPTYKLTAWLPGTDCHAPPDLVAMRRKPRAVEWLVKMWRRRGCLPFNIDVKEIHHPIRPLSKRQLSRQQRRAP